MNSNKWEYLKLSQSLKQKKGLLNKIDSKLRQKQITPELSNKYQGAINKTVDRIKEKMRNILK